MGGAVCAQVAYVDSITHKPQRNEHPRVSEIVDGARCFLHITAGKGSEQLKQVDEKMKELTKAVRACVRVQGGGRGGAGAVGAPHKHKQPTTLPPYNQHSTTGGPDGQAGLRAAARECRGGGLRRRRERAPLVRGGCHVT